MSVPLDSIELAQEGYLAYGDTTGNKNYQGLPMPEWSDLPGLIKQAWTNVAARIAHLARLSVDPVAHWTKEFDERQLQEIAFCRLYSADFAHGTDGHNAKLIIAKLAALLDANNAKAFPKE